MAYSYTEAKQTGSFPWQLKLARIKRLHNDGLENLIASSRPVASFSCTSKTLESCIIYKVLDVVRNILLRYCCDNKPDCCNKLNK